MSKAAGLTRMHKLVATEAYPSWFRPWVELEKAHVAAAYAAAAAGGLWLWKTRRPSGLMAVVLPSPLRAMVQPQR